ncbi:acyl-CoA dehydrogenase family protein [Flavisphingomonas formosensis]|uniref:acyl-CoA dehydrogenase family protein n=1 Tax=Flavisphingomonas formosensis TaxID=861534 RepID=UPI0012F9C006|nr:acyl-CoA dehydrogenase family protein [Sphingomonas formosensis]
MSMTETIDAIETIEPGELRAVAARLLADKVDRRAGWGGRLPESGALEAEMAALGWPLLTIAAASGGLGQSFAALAPIYEEIGRALAPVTIAATMAAVDVLVTDGSGATGGLLDRIGAGEARVAIAFAATSGAELTLETVPAATSATDLLLIPADDGSPVLLVGLADAEIEAIEVWDRTRPFGDIRVSLAGATPIGIVTAEARRIARAHLDLALAWDSVGAAQQVLAEAVAYMGTRKQFDRPIGSFQALKHRAADHKVAIEVAHALARQATAVYAAREAGWDHLAGQARLLAVDAFRAVAEDAVQFHGGIGFTWEHDCHLFLKRALMNEVLGETQEQVRDRIAPAIIAKALAGR